MRGARPAGPAGAGAKPSPGRAGCTPGIGLTNNKGAEGPFVRAQATRPPAFDVDVQRCDLAPVSMTIGTEADVEVVAEASMKICVVPNTAVLGGLVTCTTPR